MKTFIKMPPFDPGKLENYPNEPGVYLMKGAKGEVLYVGKAIALKKRLKQYFAKSGDTREMIPILRRQIVAIETIVVENEREALLLENTLIKKHLPKYNAFLKDDKTYVSLMMNTKHKWPRLSLVRYKGKPKEKGLFFGPYTSAFAARQTYDLLARLFPLRACSDGELERRTRPCLLYGIKRCIAPCVGACTKEEYDTFVQGAIDFLRGKDKTIVKELKKKMESASEALEFEKAAAYLQTIRQIEHVTQSRQTVLRPTAKDCDALSLFRTGNEVIVMQLIFREGRLTGSEHYTFTDVLEDDRDLMSSFLLQLYSKISPPEEILLPFPLEGASLIADILHTTLITPKRGAKKSLVNLAAKNAKATFEREKEKKELKESLLLDLVDTLKLSRYPKRIECFDTSNISGTDLAASMVAFTDGVRDSRRTRTYTIKGVDKPDDYAAMHQVLTRRLTRAKAEDDLPDLLLIDGGKGQLNCALKVLKEQGITTTDVISLSKEKGRHDKGLREEKIFIPEQAEPITLSTRSPLLFFIQQIRDTAHEKAISFHRKLRSKRTIKTSLSALPGIGPVKQKRLLGRFGSVKQILEAGEEELLSVKGITKKDIETIISV